MLIAQITDTHIQPPGSLAYGSIDVAEGLRETVHTVNRLKPDIVLHTGDFAHAGAAEAYALARDILSDLAAPLYAIPGNHDKRATMRAAFSDAAWMPEDDGGEGFIHFAVDAGPLRILMLDSTIPGEVGGRLCAARLDWLDTRLGEDGRPTIVALHHPPFPPGLEGFGKTGVEGGEGLADILNRHGHVVRIIAGHNHRSIMGAWAGVPTVVAPSACYPFAFDLTPGAKLAIAGERPGLALHHWREAFGLTTHIHEVGDLAEPRPLRP